MLSSKKRSALLKEKSRDEKQEEKENRMKAFIIDRYGSKDGVRAGEMPDPQLREDDVLIQIHAAGVNPLDLGIRDGAFKLILPYRLPLIRRYFYAKDSSA